VASTHLPLNFWGLLSHHTILELRQVPQMPTHPAQVTQPCLQQRHIFLTLCAQNDIAIKQADYLVQEERLGAGELLGWRCYDTAGFGVDEFPYAAVQHPHNHSCVCFCAVRVEDIGGEARQDAFWCMVSVEVAVQERRGVARGDVSRKTLDTGYNVV